MSRLRLVAAARGAFCTSAALLALALSAWFAPLSAQPRPIAERGDIAVTSFSGIRPGLPAPGVTNPLDNFAIDLDGTSAQVLSVREAGGPPTGQLLPRFPTWIGRASEIGQVFGLTFDDGLGRPVPNLYLAQGSAFGLHIIEPNGFGPGLHKRLQRGQPGAQWMPGMWGPSGQPGTIWRVDGMNGTVTPFTIIPGNSGAAIAGLAFDPQAKSIFAADLDTGMIHRFGPDGALREIYDHGVTGRPLRGLPPLPDDGSAIDINSPAFDSTDPATWGITPAGRRVTAMTVHRGRLWYVVAEGPQVWSVGLAPDGRIVGDARWETDIAVTAPTNQVNTITFDGEGRMILAERGAQRATYDFATYAEPGNAAVLRYRLESPDNPATPSVWEPARDEYAIGLPPEHRAATGGAALNYGHDPQTGRMRGGACNATLWSTGDRLRASGTPDPAAPANPPPDDVHGLQGNDISLVRPANVPPSQSYFVDVDSVFADAGKSGHVGLLATWQPCGGADFGTYMPPWFVPLPQPPGWLPPEFPPPRDPYRANLRLTKTAEPRSCLRWHGGDWLCGFRVEVTNTGPDTYVGPILVNDVMPALPPGATFGIVAPSWVCWATGPAAFSCVRNPAVLTPGASLAYHVYVRLSANTRQCKLANMAQIEWAPGGSPWNFDPSDDFDAASARIPAEFCPTREPRTNLQVRKIAAPKCQPMQGGSSFLCSYAVAVLNTGPGTYNGPITVRDQAPAGTTVNAVSVGAPPWACATSGATVDCTLAAVSLDPGDFRGFWVRVLVPASVVRSLDCRAPNRASILFPPGGTAQNTNAADDSEQATAEMPASFCRGDIQNPQQCPPGFVFNNGQCTQIGTFVPPVIVPPKPLPPPPQQVCPPNTVGVWPNCIRQRCPEGTIGTPPECVRAVCPRGFTGTPPDCRPIRTSCPDGFVGTPPNCVRPQCPQGTVGTPPNCVQPVCPQGFTGTPPNCQPLRCPQGFVGVPPNCERARCPEGFTGRPPNCQPARCPTGFLGTPPNCKPVQLECPAGFVGRPPNCERARCPAGFTGTPPNCKAIVVPCPAGTVGTPPNCRTIQFKCPVGTIGTPPNCRTIPVEVVRCPDGFVGRPPNCRRPTLNVPTGNDVIREVPNIQRINPQLINPQSPKIN
jgi:hypothetical protein